MANSPDYGEPRRTIRIADELWHAALATAEGRGETVPEVVRRALQRYVRQHAQKEPKPPPPERTDHGIPEL